MPPRAGSIVKSNMKKEAVNKKPERQRSGSSSRVSIYVALTTDLIIALTKFVAAAFTNSSAMVSEGIHSMIDSINEILLLVGIAKSEKPPDEKRPFGYGRELYFWSFMVSVLLFCLGGSVAFYQGIDQLRHPVQLQDLFWNYAVLGISLIFNIVSLIPPWKIFKKERGKLPFWQAIRRSKDPAVFTVLLEDVGGLLGVLIAFSGIGLGHAFNMPYLDGVASILIGIVLMTVSVILAIESRSLLMGETPARKTLIEIIRITEKDPAVKKVIRHFSIYLAPDEIVLQLIAAFKEDLSTELLVESIERIKRAIQKKFPRVKQIFIEPGV